MKETERSHEVPGRVSTDGVSSSVTPENTFSQGEGKDEFDDTHSDLRHSDTGPGCCSGTPSP